MRKEKNKAVLIFDGNCPVCSQSIKWIQGHARRNAFEMLPCQAESRKERFPSIGEDACMQAMQLVLPEGEVLSGAEAMPEILKRLRRFSSAAVFFGLPGARTFARIFYRWFADRRYDIAKLLFHGKRGTAAQRERGDASWKP